MATVADLIDYLGQVSPTSRVGLDDEDVEEPGEYVNLAFALSEMSDGEIPPPPVGAGEPGGHGPGAPPRLTDDQGLNAIQLILRDPEWGVGMLEDIREIVEGTGRDCQGDGTSTWERH